ncbi:unnamed protein product, partial [Prunus brigantina]
QKPPSLSEKPHLKSNPTPSNIQPHPIENSLLLQTHPIAHPIRFTTTSIAEPSKNPSLCHRLHHRTIKEPIPLPSQNHLCSPPNPIAQPSKPEPISVTITPISISANLKAIEGQVFTNPYSRYEEDSQRYY